MAAESKKSVGEVINIGSNFEITIEDLVYKIVSLIDKKVEIVQEDVRLRPVNSEVERLWCDNTKASELLGWTPKFSLEDGLKDTIKWISDNIDFFKVDIYNR